MRSERYSGRLPWPSSFFRATVHKLAGSRGDSAMPRATEEVGPGQCHHAPHTRDGALVSSSA